MAEMVPTSITRKSVAIVKFGPAGFHTDGMRPAEPPLIVTGHDEVVMNFLKD